MNERILTNPFAFVPLSEENLVLPDGSRELNVAEGEEKLWYEVTHLTPGEKRNLAVDIWVARGGHGRFLRVIHVPFGSRLTLVHRVRVDAEASWTSVIAVRGAGEVVVQRMTEVFGEKANVFLGAVSILLESADLKVDDDIVCRAPQATVTLRTHTVLQDEARADTRGRIVVTPQAPGSRVDESLSHLLLGHGAKARSIPELDIAHRDVVCHHRSSLGRPRDEERFYLQARGLSEAQINRLFARGFLRSALAGLSPDHAQQLLQELEGTV